jgi:hypothetical protein
MMGTRRRLLAAARGGWNRSRPSPARRAIATVVWTRAWDDYMSNPLALNRSGDSARSDGLLDSLRTEFEKARVALTAELVRQKPKAA